MAVLQRVLVACLCMVWLGSAALATPRLVPSPPSLPADAYVLVDAGSGRVLAEHNADERLAPASLVKMMTAYILALELDRGNVSHDDMVTISRNAWAQNPVFSGSSLMWIEVGRQVALEDLHRGLLVSSGNDASVAIAEHIAGSEAAFVDLMNQYAEVLGMTNTRFGNVHGLDDRDQYTSARDMVTLTRALMRFPQSYALHSERSYTYNGITTHNRNRLLWRDPSLGVDGVKTGRTGSAGWCLVASAQRGDMRLISVVMNAESWDARERHTQTLLNYGFNHFEGHRPYATGSEVTRHRVWGGAADDVALGVDQDLFLTIPRGRQRDIRAVINVDQVVRAPVAAGDVHGELVVTLDDEELLRSPLVALEAVERGGVLRRLWHAITLFILGLFS